MSLSTVEIPLVFLLTANTRKFFRIFLSTDLGSHAGASGPRQGTVQRNKKSCDRGFFINNLNMQLVLPRFLVPAHLLSKEP